MFSTTAAAESGPPEEEISRENGGDMVSREAADAPAVDVAESPDETQLLFDEPDGADDEAAGQLGEGVGMFGIWDFVRMVLVLGLVIAAVYAVFFVLRRAAGGRYRSSEFIKLLGSQPLPGNRALHLIQVGSQVFLVGAGDSTVNLVSEITDRETIDELRLQANNSEQQPASRGFSELISGAVRVGDRSAEGAEAGNSIQFMSRQRERLRNLR